MKKNCLLIGLPLLLFILIAAFVITKNTTQYDDFVYYSVARFINPGLTNIMQLIAFLGSGLFLIPFSLVIFLVLYKKEKNSFCGSMILINIALSYISILVIKYFINRERPNINRLIEIDGLSFPSGHSVVSMSFYGLLIFLFYKNYKSKWKYFIMSLLGLLILSIGISRIYLGVHYFSDVVGGFTLGALWVGFLSSIVNRKYTKIASNN